MNVNGLREPMKVELSYVHSNEHTQSHAIVQLRPMGVQLKSEAQVTRSQQQIIPDFNVQTELAISQNRVYQLLAKKEGSNIKMNVK